MTKTELQKEYFEWMYQLVFYDRFLKGLSYRKVLERLREIQFRYILPMDGNRDEDGIDLRYRFGYDHGIEDPIIASYLDDRPCSVLEMMIALSVRCEENIMENPDIGNRTGLWFWKMITNLGLGKMDDTRYNQEYVDSVVSIFLERKYNPDGKGGLFVVKKSKYDLRTVEIWYQMCWYLDDIS